MILLQQRLSVMRGLAGECRPVRKNGARDQTGDLWLIISH